MEVIPREELQNDRQYSIIDPRELGVTGVARVCIYSRIKKEYTHLLKVTEEQVVRFTPKDCGPSITYRVDRLGDGRWQVHCPHFQLLPFENKGSMNGVQILTSGSLRYTVRRDVVIAPYCSLHSTSVPHGVRSVYSIGKFVPEALRFQLLKQIDAPGPEVPHKNYFRGRVIFGDLPNSSFGHFLTEGLSRLWYAKRHPEIPIDWFHGKEISESQQEILNLLGVVNPQILVKKPTFFDEVVFPFPGICLGDNFEPEHAEFLGFFNRKQHSNRNNNAPRKLFLSRSALTGVRGKSDADKLLEDILTDHGFEVFFPENFSLIEQLDAIVSADVVVGVEGSALHLPLLLADPVQTKFIALARHRRGGGVFEHVRQVKQLDYQTYDFSVDPLRKKLAKDPLYIDFEKFKRAVSLTGGFEKNFEEIKMFKCFPHHEVRSFEYFLERAKAVSFAEEFAAFIERFTKHVDPSLSDL